MDLFWLQYAAATRGRAMGYWEQTGVDNMRARERRKGRSFSFIAGSIIGIAVFAAMAFWAVLSVVARY